MRRFLLISSIVATPLYLCLAWWLTFIAGKTTGDLGRLGSIPFGAQYDAALAEKMPAFPEAGWVEFRAGIEPGDYRIFTVGDSFSEMSDEGFQHYLGNMSGSRILRLPNPHGPMQTAAAMANAGFFDRCDSAVLIVETVERSLITEVLRTDFHLATYPQYVPPETKLARTTSDITLDQFFNWASIHLLGTRRPVKTALLDREVFTDSKRANRLYFYEEDLARHASITPQKIETAKQNLKTLRELLAQKSVRLICLVAADKYDAYQPLIVDNRHPAVTTLEHFSDMDSTWFIDSKKILLPRIEAGEKDIYKLNDTHWSWKGSEIVAKHLYHTIGSD